MGCGDAYLFVEQGENVAASQVAIHDLLYEVMHGWEQDLKQPDMPSILCFFDMFRTMHLQNERLDARLELGQVVVDGGEGCLGSCVEPLLQLDYAGSIDVQKLCT